MFFLLFISITIVNLSVLEILKSVLINLKCSFFILVYEEDGWCQEKVIWHQRIEEQITLFNALRVVHEMYLKSTIDMENQTKKQQEEVTKEYQQLGEKKILLSKEIEHNQQYSYQLSKEKDKEELFGKEKMITEVDANNKILQTKAELRNYEECCREKDKLTMQLHAKENEMKVLLQDLGRIYEYM